MEQTKAYNWKCSIKDCESQAMKKTHLASCDEIQTLIGQPVTTFAIEEGTTFVTLCQQHYNLVYKELHQPLACNSCGEKPKKGEHFSKCCPEPTAINTYLHSVTGIVVH